MEAVLKVISRSAAWVAGKPDVPQRVQVVIQAGQGRERVSVTKHLRYQGGQYVGRAYDYRKRRYEEIVFPPEILLGAWTENVRLAA